MHVETVDTKIMKQNTFNGMHVDTVDYRVWITVCILIQTISNCKILWINASNYMKLRIKALYYFELETLRSRSQLNSLRISGTSN